MGISLTARCAFLELVTRWYILRSRRYHEGVLFKDLLLFFRTPFVMSFDPQPELTHIFAISPSMTASCRFIEIALSISASRCRPLPKEKSRLNALQETSTVAIVLSNVGWNRDVRASRNNKSSCVAQIVLPNMKDRDLTLPGLVVQLIQAKVRKHGWNQ